MNVVLKSGAHNIQVWCDQNYDQKQIKLAEFHINE